jgi:hypothetical protein
MQIDRERDEKGGVPLFSAPRRENAPAQSLNDILAGMRRSLTDHLNGVANKPSGFVNASALIVVDPT